MDFAVLTSPVWWMARQWLRFLTGLAIIAVALGPVRVAPAITVHASPVVAVSAAVTASPAVAAEAAPAVVVEPDPIVVAQAPVRVRLQRPAQTAEPASVDVTPAGQRAPPAAPSAL